MLFAKSAPVVSRSAFAAKSRSNKFWASSNQSQNGPGFFVSTPQFTRHQNSQLAPYVEDGRGAGSSGPNSDSYSIDNPYLPLTAGANTAAAAPNVIFDDESKEETSSKVQNSAKRGDPYVLNASIKSLDRTQLTSRIIYIKDELPSSTAITDSGTADPLAVAIDRTDRRDLVNGVLNKMRRLQSVGSHSAVLDTFEDLETLETKLPIEAYNMVLKSLAFTGDINTLLEGYERMLVRGLHPTDSTYNIVIKALADVAESLSVKRSQLLPLLGTGSDYLESVDEIREGLSVEEHLLLALAILEPIATAHTSPLHPDLQVSLDRIVGLCIDNNVSVPPVLVDSASSSVVQTIRLQPSIVDAASQFTTLAPAQQQSEDAQAALLSSYFHFREPASAIEFFSSCGSPRYLLKPLLTGLASAGFTANARKWLSEVQPSKNTITAVLGAIPLAEAKEVLPSATEIFFQLIDEEARSGAPSFQHGSGGSDGSASDIPSVTDEGRCSYLRLCVAAGDSEALFMAIRESRYSQITWDAITLSQVLKFFVDNGQPLLAADICAWQIPALASAYNQGGVRGFVEEEIISDTVRYLQNSDQLSLDASLRLLPVVVVCTQARKQILDIIFAAKVGAPHEIARLVDAENLPAIVRSLASILNNSNLRATQEEHQLVAKLLPSFVENAIAVKAEFTEIDVANVHEALKECSNAAPLISLWLKRNSERVKSPTAAHSKNEHLSSEMSLNITRFAKSPNGVDHAIRLLKDQLSLNIPVSNDAVEAVIEACVRSGESEELSHLYTLIPKTQSSMNALARAAAGVDNVSLAIDCYKTIVDDLKLFPTVPTYNALISSPAQTLDEAVRLFNEAKGIAQIPLDADIYNAMATKFALNLKKDDLASIMMEMHELRFQLYPTAYGYIIDMSIKLQEGHQALSMLKSAPATTKSLLDVKVFNDLMDYFVKASDRDAALEVFMELRNSGTLATPHTYRLLMNAYLTRNQNEEPSLSNADRVLSLMRQDGAPITPECFATLVRARGVLFKDLASSCNFYRGMVKNSRVLPNKSVFEALMESYICNGKGSEISTVLDEMKRYRVPLDGSLSRMITNCTK